MKQAGFFVLPRDLPCSLRPSFTSRGSTLNMEREWSKNHYWRAIVKDHKDTVTCDVDSERSGLLYVLFFNISVVCCTHGRLLSVFLVFTIHLQVRRSHWKGYGFRIGRSYLWSGQISGRRCRSVAVSVVYTRSLSHLLATINQKAL